LPKIVPCQHGWNATLASILAKARPGIRLNEHIEGDGPTVFAHGCKMGLEGIVSKRKDSAYRSGRSRDWVKKKDPDAPAATREAEEDWSWVGVLTIPSMTAATKPTASRLIM
jgi:hypothetical protein